MFEAMKAQHQQRINVNDTTFVINRGVHVNKRNGQRLNVVEKYSPLENLTYYIADSMIDRVISKLIEKEKARYEQG